jgi:hypothetical protein
MLSSSLGVEPLYRATKRPQLVVVPPLRFACVDGSGDPNSDPAYASAVQALYAVSYAAKFAVRKRGGEDFRVSPLEGLWWADDMRAFEADEKAAWNWTMMIRQPDAVTDDLIADVLAEVAAKKSLPVLDQLRIREFAEGPAAQVLHVGPYSAEGPTIARLHAFIAEQGFELAGEHHEIYLGDPRRAAPERLRTILRQPYAA